MNAPDRQIRVMIIEDDSVVRILLEHIIERDPRLVVAASVGSGEAALRALPEIKPDVISLDIRLPGINGFDVTRAVMSSQPTPIVVVSASVEADDLRISMNALRAGALAVVEKPVGVTHTDYELLATRLCRNLVLMSDVALVRQRRLDPPPSAAATRAWAPSCASAANGYQMLGLVASTGGPNALVEVLKVLTPDFPLPIALVQHITATFLDGFVSWLSGATGFTTRIVRDSQPMVRGNIFVAAADRHLLIKGDHACLGEQPKIEGQRPSGSILFESMSQSGGHRAIGVLLTGMGEDGASGLLALRNAGGYTIAEDETSAVVYGMPKAAMRLGAVTEQLPLSKIGPRLKTLAATTGAKV